MSAPNHGNTREEEADPVLPLLPTLAALAIALGRTLAELAELSRGVVSHMDSKRSPVDLAVVPSDDKRSYRISSGRILRQLGFKTKRTISQAMESLVAAFQTGKVTDPQDPRYHNIRTMQMVHLQ